METTENDKYLHIVLSLADQESEEIGEIWFDDVSIPLIILTVRVVTSGPYANKVRIKIFGNNGQTADADLVSETLATLNFRGRGVTYIYVRLRIRS